MKIDALNAANATTAATGATNATQGGAKVDFMAALKSSIDELNAQQKTSEEALSDIATGQIKDLHQAGIAIGKAESSMKIMLEVRNKAINAYKEILRTQV